MNKEKEGLDINLDDILRQIDPNARLDNNVREALTEFTEDYVDKVLQKICELAKHRGSSKITAADARYVLAHYFSK